MPAVAVPSHLLRDPGPMLERTLAQWGGRSDLWIFAYASLIWNPGFDYRERRPARVHGWHRALAMWSRTNRGSPQCPGLVFCMLSGGSCLGLAYRIPRAAGAATLGRLWQREMPNGVYDPRWLPCHTPQGPVQALAFTLSRRSPSYTGTLDADRVRQIFAQAHGRYGSTRDYAQSTLEGLRAHGIHDHALQRLMLQAG